MVNTYGALILTNAAFNLAFAVWILHGFFASIPKEVEEAANLDGCSRFGTMRRVMLPLTLPGVVTAMIFTFIAAWNEYVVALTLMHRRRQEAAHGGHQRPTSRATSSTGTSCSPRRSSPSCRS